VSGQRKALIIANDVYEQKALRNLLAPVADADALGRMLGDRQIGGFAVQTVWNQPANVIKVQIEALFSESRVDDVLLLYYSGLGLKSESGELFFAASNTCPDRLGVTSVSADFVQRSMRYGRSRSIVLLLDCWYGGAFLQGVKLRAVRDVNLLDSFPREGAGERGRAVITASKAIEFASEGNLLADNQHRRPSVFTSALVEGLATGNADRDEDGLVSLDELYHYAFDKVQEQDPQQTLSRDVELEGELYLARRPRWRVRPAPISPVLQAAITDPNMYTRVGAVGELRSLLASEDLSVAAGAYDALAELARTDIPYVADAASGALSQAKLTAGSGSAAGPSTPKTREQQQYAKQKARTDHETGGQIEREPDIAVASAAEAQAERETRVQATELLRPKIFLCYRREDTQGFARGIYESLANKYGHEQVFRDIDSTPAGVKYSVWIESRVGQCSVMIVLIGNAWLSAEDRTGQRRLDLSKDWVRQEIEVALRRDIPIIPVRIQGAPMPSEDELPPSIADLSGFQSAEVADSRWAYDIGQLIQAVDNLVASD
jgi:TIR domain/Caspase domain